MIVYKLQENHPVLGITSVIKLPDENGYGGSCIPFDEANRDFVEYQEWLSLGNLPLPPDESTLS